MRAARTATLGGVASSLRREGEALRARPAKEVLDVLCEVLEQWRAPDSPWRARLVAQLPEAAGFSPEVVRDGVALALGDWSGDALRAVFGRELAGVDHATGFALTSVLLAGAIPTPTLLSLLAPLAVRSPVLAKAAARDPVTPALVAESIAAIDPALGRCLAVVSFASDDDEARRVFLGGDCVVATGSDATIESVSQEVTGAQRLLRHGHRLSVAAIGPDAVSGDALADVARRLALDTALWDQQGCLSPVAVFVADPDPDAPRRVARALARALARAERMWPRGETPTEAAAAIRRERGEAEMRAAAGRRVGVLASEGTEWSVVFEDDASWRPAPLHRFLRVHPLPASDAAPDGLERALRPVAPHLAAVALAGFAAGAPTLERRLAALGASRICAPGRLQLPPLGWRRDGMGLLAPLARLADIEPD